MAKITNINLINFRNFSKFDLNLHKKTNVFFGDNGSGKTNLLEAISLLSKGRGIRNSQIIEKIKNNEKDFVIDSSIKIKDNDYNVKIFNTNKDDKLKKYFNKWR